jgi:hypothetical protein
MDNGCVCCSVRGDLIRALLTLKDRKDKKFDSIIIETTGLADPAPVAFTFFTNPEIADHYELDGTFWQPNSSAVKIHCTLLSKMTQFGRDPDSISGGDNFFFSFFMV